MTTKRIVVGAHYGLKDWLAQRVSAVVLAVYTVILLLALMAQPELSYGSWAGLFASGWMKVFTLAGPSVADLARLDRRARHFYGLHQAHRGPPVRADPGHPGPRRVRLLGSSHSVESLRWPMF